MTTSKISVGLQVGTQPPLGAVRAFVGFARLARLDSVMAVDHFQNVFPRAIWDEDFSWLAAQRATPHEHFDYQVFLGYLASRVGRIRLGVGVTEPIRRHPVLIAQAMLTLSHITRRPPILGIGAGERMNLDPYGLDFSEPVGRLEEALEIILLCFSSQGPVDFEGKHFRLDGAVMDLMAPDGKMPEVWVAGHGPRMLRLTGEYGDGWYPTMVVSPDEYAAKLAVVRDAARRSGRDAEMIEPALHRFVVVAPTERETRAMLDTRAIRAFGLAAPAGITPIEASALASAASARSMRCNRAVSETISRIAALEKSGLISADGISGVDMDSPSICGRTLCFRRTPAKPVPYCPAACGGS